MCVESGAQKDRGDETIAGGDCRVLSNVCVCVCARERKRKCCGVALSSAVLAVAVCRHGCRLRRRLLERGCRCRRCGRVWRETTERGTKNKNRERQQRCICLDLTTAKYYLYNVPRRDIADIHPRLYTREQKGHFRRKGDDCGVMKPSLKVCNTAPMSLILP